jgi:drug/metabolite transporter (DMT)-like permease
MIPLWLPLTILSAFTLATSDALTKKALHGRNEYLVSWLRLLPSVPIFLSMLLFIPTPQIGSDFYICVFTAAPLEAFTIFLYAKALKLSPLNLTLPLLSLTPLLLMIVPFLLLGETVSSFGAAGIVLIAAGGYLLNVRPGQQGGLAPLKALLSERGAVYMLCVAAIYSITATLGKRAIAASSPLFFICCYVPLMAALISPVALYKGRGEIRGMAQNGMLRATALPALFYLLQAVTHVIAINMTNVAYMIAVKRLSLLFGVLYGRYLFRERGGVAATLIMLAGVSLIALWG